MPNGGSDCCGTCWFNAKNKGKAGYEHADDPESAFCLIRNIAIDDPFYTYCHNHPCHRPEQDQIPIGPVFTGNSLGERQFWQPSPDTEEIRQHLLSLLNSKEYQPASKKYSYPESIYADEVVVWQLGEFREVRALPGVQQIADFNPLAYKSGSFARSREELVKLAHEAITKIKGEVTPNLGTDPDE